MSAREKGKEHALHAAMRALTARPRSEQEIVERLEERGYDEEIIAQTMADLQDAGLIDDEAFAREWVYYRTSRGLGPWRIRQELRQKGVDRYIIEDVLEDIDEDDSLETATEIALHTLRTADKNGERRAFDKLARRGFSFSLARQALAQAQAVLDEEEEEDDDEDEDDE